MLENFILSNLYTASIFFITSSVATYLACYFFFRPEDDGLNPEHSVRDLTLTLVMAPFTIGIFVVKMYCLYFLLSPSGKIIWALYQTENSIIVWQNAVFIMIGTLGFLRLVNFHRWFPNSNREEREEIA